jgi:hypothetical protein
MANLLMKHCHFCKGTVGLSDDIHFYCQACSLQYDLYQVITTRYYPTYENMFARIFARKDIVGVQLNLEENKTLIYGSNVFIILPGFPIFPANAHHKIQLYLTFS